MCSVTEQTVLFLGKACFHASGDDAEVDVVVVAADGEEDL